MKVRAGNLMLVLGAALIMASPFHTAPAAPISASLGTISGRVTMDDGKPAAGCSIVARSTRYVTPAPAGEAVTDADGRYSIRLDTRLSPRLFQSVPPAPADLQFTVTVEGQKPLYLIPPDRTVTFPPDLTLRGVNFQLSAGPQVTIRVHDALTGAPDAGLTVRYGPEWGVDRTAGVTGPDGMLRVRIPFTKANFRIDLPDTLEAAPSYGAGSSFYKQVTAEPGQEVVWNLKTYETFVHIGPTGNRSYGPEGDASWHGLVLGADGRPAAGVSVTLLRQYEEGVNLLTDAAGRFSTRMSRFQYGEAPEWSPHISPVVYARRGALMAAQIITPDESWDGVILRLTPGAVVTGRLADPQGRPAASVGVSLTGNILRTDGRDFSFPKTTTDDQGRFVFPGLPPGYYSVEARGSGYGTVDIPPPTLSTLPRVTLVVAAGERRNLGKRIIPRADRTLTGMVVDRQGQPLHLANIEILGAHAQQYAASQQDGTFRVENLVDEPLRVTLGDPGNQVVAEVAPGQKSVRLVIPPEIAAAHAFPSITPPPNPPVPAQGPVSVFPSEKTISLNGLGLILQPATGGKFTATVLRPDEPMPQMQMMFPDFSRGSMTTLWQGTLEDVEGMRLTVHQNRGTLADRAGRVLWSGAAEDPPDYTLTLDYTHFQENGFRSCMTSVRNSHGTLLWSGAAGPNTLWSPVQDGVLRITGPDNKVVWERAVGNARVAVRTVGPRYMLHAHGPLDGVVTLHVVSATGTLRTAEGRILWSGSAFVVTTRAVGSVATEDWPVSQPLLGFQNPPKNSVLTLADSAGAAIPNTTLTFR